MDAHDLIEHALRAVDGKQSRLANRLGVSETTVSRWRAGKNGIDYGSALRLARITGLPATTVFEACGLDPRILPDVSQSSANERLDGIDPAISMLLDRERVEMSDLLHGVPRVWWPAIIDAQRYARKAAESHALDMERTLREGRISTPRDGQLAAPEPKPAEKGRRRSRPAKDSLANTFQSLQHIGSLLTAASPGRAPRISAAPA